MAGEVWRKGLVCPATNHFEATVEYVKGVNSSKTRWQMAIFPAKTFQSCFAQHRERYRTHPSHCDSQIFTFRVLASKLNAAAREKRHHPHHPCTFFMGQPTTRSWGNLPDPWPVNSQCQASASPQPKSKIRLLGGKKTPPTWKSGSLSGKAVF